MRTIVLAILLSLAALPALAAPAAADPSVEDVIAEHQALTSSARDLALDHFQAIARGDRKALTALWSPAAEVTSRSGTETTVAPIKRAVRRWLSARDGFEWRVGDAGVLADGRVWVTANVTWNKARFHDTLLLERTAQGLRFAGKVSVALGEERQAY